MLHRHQASRCRTWPSARRRNWSVSSCALLAVLSHRTSNDDRCCVSADHPGASLSQLQCSIRPVFAVSPQDSGDAAERDDCERRGSRIGNPLSSSSRSHFAFRQRCTQSTRSFYLQPPASSLQSSQAGAFAAAGCSVLEVQQSRLHVELIHTSRRLFLLCVVSAIALLGLRGAELRGRAPVSHGSHKLKMNLRAEMHSRGFLQLTSTVQACAK